MLECLVNLWLTVIQGAHTCTNLCTKCIVITCYFCEIWMWNKLPYLKACILYHWCGALKTLWKHNIMNCCQHECIWKHVFHITGVVPLKLYESIIWIAVNMNAMVKTIYLDRKCFMLELKITNILQCVFSHLLLFTSIDLYTKYIWKYILYICQGLSLK